MLFLRLFTTSFRFAVFLLTLPIGQFDFIFVKSFPTNTIAKTAVTPSWGVVVVCSKLDFFSYGVVFIGSEAFSMFNFIFLYLLLTHNVSPVQPNPMLQELLEESLS